MSDLIRRENAMKVAMWFGRSEQKYSHSFIKKRVMEIPSAERKGEWIDAEIRHEDGVLPIQVCSECKTFYPLKYTGGGHRFCPNCGARMKGADDDNA